MPDNHVIQIATPALYELSEPYMTSMCGLDRGNKMAEKILKKAMRVRGTTFDETHMKMVISELEPTAIADSTLQLGSERIDCYVFHRIPKAQIEKLVLFALHAPMPDLEHLPISELYLADTWQTAFVDAARDYLRDHLEQLYTEKMGHAVCITDAVGPGFYGMQSQDIEPFFQIIDADKAGITLTQSGMMSPVKSIVGFFMVVKEGFTLPTTDCATCVGNQSGCTFCKNYRGAQKRTQQVS